MRFRATLALAAVAALTLTGCATPRVDSLEDLRGVSKSIGYECNTPVDNDDFWAARCSDSYGISYFKNPSTENSVYQEKVEYRTAGEKTYFVRGKNWHVEGYEGAITKLAEKLDLPVIVLGQ